MVYSGEYKLWNSSLCSVLQPPVCFLLMRPNILLSTLFSKTFSLCSLLWARSQSSVLYRIRDKVIVIYLVCTFFLDNIRRDRQWCTDCNKIFRISSAINFLLKAILIFGYPRKTFERFYNFEGFILSVTACVRHIWTTVKVKETDE
jgi:hypothetical protein